MTEHSMPASACLGCGKRLDAATGLTGSNAPIPGNFTICLDCGTIMAFTADLTLRELTDAEVTEIAGDPRLLRVQRIRAAYQRQQQ